MQPEQGGIYWVDLDPTVGREQRGPRPALVVGRDEINELPLTTLVMIGSGAEHFDSSRRRSTEVWVTADESGLPKDTVFLAIQLRSIDASRLGAKMGALPLERLPEAWAAIRYLLGDDGD
jgi:mRNA interferase MazF